MEYVSCFYKGNLPNCQQVDFTAAKTSSERRLREYILVSECEHGILHGKRQISNEKHGHSSPLDGSIPQSVF